MNLLMSWSSGKDSAWSLHRLRLAGEHQVVGLITTVNEVHERVAMHAVRVKLLEAQARAAGLPLTVVPLPHPCPNGEYEARMDAALREARARGVEGVAFGDLFLEDIRAYRVAQLAPVGLTPVFPLWGEPTGPLSREMVDGGLRAIITCVDPRQLDPAFAGRAFDHALLDALPAGVDPCGENGEMHSFVWDGPMFSAPIPVEGGEVVEREGFVFADVRPAGGLSS